MNSPMTREEVELFTKKLEASGFVKVEEWILRPKGSLSYRYSHHNDNWILFIETSLGNGKVLRTELSSPDGNSKGIPRVYIWEEEKS